MMRTHFVGTVALAALQLILAGSLSFTLAASTPSESTIYNFIQYPQGPSIAGLIADPKGNLYGTALDGQNTIVFRLSNPPTDRGRRRFCKSSLGQLLI
jgi:hypothetical protein